MQSVACLFSEQSHSVAVFSVHIMRKYRETPNPMQNACSDDYFKAINNCVQLVLFSFFILATSQRPELFEVRF